MNNDIIDNSKIFLNKICIDSGVGYDLKEIMFSILNGEINSKEALEEWVRRGHYLF